MPARPMRKNHRHTSKSESGQGLILGVVFMVSAIMLTALVADVGFALVGKRNIQNAADAAALAGAGELPENPDAAVADAREWAHKNGLTDEEINSITVSTTSYPNDTIRVKLNRDIGFMLGTVMDVTGGSVSSRAAARAVSPVGASAMAPLAVLESTFSGLAPGDPAILKYDATTNTSGNFLPLAIDATGSREYEANLKNGSEQWICAQGFEQPGCVSSLDTEPGNLIGGTRQALNWILANTSTSCDTYAEVFDDVDDTTGFASLTPSCNRFTSPSSHSYRIVLVPIIDTLCNGSCSVDVVSFAMFFIESYTCTNGGQGNGCDLVGRYAKANADIQGLIGDYDPNGTSRFVRLVE